MSSVEVHSSTDFLTDWPQVAVTNKLMTTPIIAAARGLDAREFLSREDAYHFFQPPGDLPVTGPANTNVNDVRMVSVDLNLVRRIVGA